MFGVVKNSGVGSFPAGESVAPPIEMIGTVASGENPWAPELKFSVALKSSTGAEVLPPNGVAGLGDSKPAEIKGDSSAR
jgi:hypothetical protein